MKKSILKFLFLMVFLFFPSWSSASEKIAGEVQTQKFVLDNGLTVLVTEMPNSPAVSVFGLVKTGSVMEGKYLGAGISHFLEHMLFKGTEKRGVGQISREVQALGGEINASTSFDYTIYTLTVPQGHFDEALDIISDMLTHSKFDPEQIQKEREVVYGEMRLYKDNPERYLSQMVFNTVYKQHPYGIPIIGYEELLRPLNREDFLDYYHTHYLPNKTIISIAGNVRAQEILAKAKETFKDFKRQIYFLRNLAPEPPQISMRYTEDEYPTDLTRFSMAYSGVSTLDPDLFAMDVLAMILGEGESSRLYKNIFLKKGLVRSITASNFTPIDCGVFEIQAVLDEANLDETIKAVKAQIHAVAEQGVTQAELEKTKRQVVAQHIFGRLTSDVVANTAAADEAFNGDFDFSKKYVEAVKKITSEDIKRVAKKYFVDERLSLVVLKPKKGKIAALQAAVDVKPAQIQKITLDNGMTILLRENHEFPIVAVNLVLNGGTSQETTANNGICELTSRLWTQGTRTRSSANIAESVESRGATLSPISGRNSFGLTMNLLSQDTDFGLNLLEDLIKDPVFPDQEFLVEKQKVRTGIMSEEDSISSVTARNLREALFLTHPFRFDGLGTLETVEKIKRQDVMEFYRKLAAPNNMVLSVFGDINPSPLIESLKKRFGGLTQRPVKLLTCSEPPPEKIREKTVRLNKKQAMIMIGFQGVDLKSKDRYGMQVLTSILGSPFSGRIFNTVRDQFGHAYTLGGGFTPSRDIGMINFHVLTTDENVDQVKGLLTKLINEIRERDVSAQELKEIKTYLKGSFAMDIQTDASLGFISALDELYGTGYNYYQSFDRLIDAVTIEDIKRLAVKYLDLNKAAIVIARPTVEAAAQKPTQRQMVPMPSGPSDIH